MPLIGKKIVKVITLLKPATDDCRWFRLTYSVILSLDMTNARTAHLSYEPIASVRQMNGRAIVDTKSTTVECPL